MIIVRASRPASETSWHLLNSPDEDWSMKVWSFSKSRSTADWLYHTTTSSSHRKTTRVMRFYFPKNLHYGYIKKAVWSSYLTPDTVFCVCDRAWSSLDNFSFLLSERLPGPPLLADVAADPHPQDDHHEDGPETASAKQREDSHQVWPGRALGCNRL